MKPLIFLSYAFLSGLVVCSAKEKIVAAYPLVKSVAEWRRMVEVSAPDAEELWLQESDGIIISLLKRGRSIYVCGYATNPGFFKFVDELTKWDVVDPKSGKPVMLGGVDSSDSGQIEMNIATVDENHNYLVKVYYFGKRLNLPSDRDGGIRLILPNIKRAFDIDVADATLAYVYNVQSNTEFVEIPQNEE